MTKTTFPILNHSTASEIQSLNEDAKGKLCWNLNNNTDVPISVDVGEYFETVLPKQLELDFSKEDWDLLKRGITVGKHTRLSLPREWVVDVEEVFKKIKKFPCCLSFKRHYVYTKENQPNLFRFCFSCKFPSCKMKGIAYLKTSLKLKIVFLLNMVKHRKNVDNSFKGRHLRNKKRTEIAKKVISLKYPSKLYHDFLADDNKTNMESGLLEVNSKNVLRQIKCEAKKLKLPALNINDGLLKLQQNYKDMSKNKKVKGYIQFLNHNPLLVGVVDRRRPQTLSRYGNRSRFDSRCYLRNSGKR